MIGFDLLGSTETTGPDGTKRLAAAVAAVLDDGDLLVLTGDLGAGKTCFTQGLAAGLGIDDRVTSPTFTLANRYQGRLVLNHLDVYRLDGPGDSESLGLHELLDDGVTAIEWGDRIEGALPGDFLLVALRYPDHDDAHEGAPESVHGSPETGVYEAPTRRIVELWARPGSGWVDRLDRVLDPSRAAS